MPIAWTMPVEEARAIVHGKDPEFETVEHERIGERKGVSQYRGIYREIATGRCWRTTYHEGPKFTYAFDGYIEPFHWEQPTFTEVIQLDVIVSMWVDAKKNRKKTKKPMMLTTEEQEMILRRREVAKTPEQKI